MVQKMRKHRSIRSVNYMIHVFITTIIVKTCVESLLVEALEEIFHDRNGILNSGLQIKDRYGGKKIHYLIMYWG